MSNGKRRNLRPGILPAQDLDAEKGLLGSLMIVSDCFDVVAPILHPAHFYLQSNGKIYAAIIRLHANGVRGFDAVTIANELAKGVEQGSNRNDLEEIGGESYLVECLNSVPHAGHAEYYASIIVEKWQLRELLYLGTDLVADSYQSESQPEDVAAAAIDRIEKLLERRSSQLRKVQSGLMKFLEAQERDDPPGLLTGFLKFDGMTNGLKRGALMILAARTSVGKTAFVGKLALNVARAGGGVMFVSLEQPEDEIAGRWVIQTTRLDSHRVLGKRLNDEEKARMIEAATEIDSLPIWVDDTASQTVTDIASKARLLKVRHGLELVIVDYLQLIAPTNPKDLREQQVAQIARKLKQTALELGVPIVALSQLSRAVETRESKRPRLSDLRESGAIEQDADLVTFLHRKGMYDEDEDPYTAELIVEKNRGGRTGDVPLRWVPECMVYEDVGSVEGSTGDPFAHETGGFIPWNAEPSLGDF